MHDGKGLLKGIDRLSKLVPGGFLRRHLAIWVYYVPDPHNGLKLESAHIQELTEVPQYAGKKEDVFKT